MGGNPFGPAGTGKTESVKALGAQLGRFVLVFNCDESFDYSAMGRLFAGLCQVRSGVHRHVLEWYDLACGCHVGRFHHRFPRDEAYIQLFVVELINAATRCAFCVLSVFLQSSLWASPCADMLQTKGRSSSEVLICCPEETGQRPTFYKVL